MRISDWSSDVCSSDLKTTRERVIGYYANLMREADLLQLLLESGSFHQVIKRLYRSIGGEPIEFAATKRFLKSLRTVIRSAYGANLSGFNQVGERAQGFLEGDADIVSVGLVEEIGRASCRERVCQYV